MIVTGKALSRRTVLRGIGASVALPLLDSMVPAFGALARAATTPVGRLGVVYVPNGVVMKNWTPAADGPAFEVPLTLQPLVPYRDRLLVLSGLSSTPPDDGLTGGNIGVHARASTRFLTDVPPRHVQNTEIHAGISMDQIAARELGQHTQLASLELALDGRDFAGSCDVGYSCVYNNTIAWRSDTTPLPMENNPRVVFERLFGSSGTTDPGERLARIEKNRSLLDSVTEKVAQLQKGIGARDRAKLNQYLDAIRDIERRIQNAEAQSAQEIPVVEQPAGIPAAFEDHATLMFDLQVLAYQCDLTRVITFMMGREISGRTFPQIGVHEAHHPVSHHNNDPVKLANLAKINAYHAKLFAYYVNKLHSTPDGDGSLLDHMILVYGYGMADGNAHAPSNLPMLLLGGARQFKGGRHLRYPTDTPLANLHLTLLDKLGVPTVEHIGDSTGRLEHLSI